MVVYSAPHVCICREGVGAEESLSPYVRANENTAMWRVSLLSYTTTVHTHLYTDTCTFKHY